MSNMKDIPWFEWIYAITQDWRVWSYPKRWHSGVFLKPYIIPVWYEYVRLMCGKKTKGHRVHRLVALTYLPNPKNYLVVRHLDNNPLNNHVSNLDWCTQSTNIKQSYYDGRSEVSEYQKKRIWEATIKRCAKKVWQFTESWEIINKFISASEAGRCLWISQSNISACASLSKWHNTAHGFIFKYI